MKKIITFICVGSLFLSGIHAFGQVGITFRPYARAGLNLLPPSMEDLDYSDGFSDATIKRNPIAAGAGAQILLQKEDIRLGVDIGAGTIFRNLVVYEVTGTGTSNHLDQEYSVYTLAVAEKMLDERIFIQGGAGIHIAPWYYEYYYESENYTDVQNYYSGVGVSFAIMAAIGAEFPLSPGANLFMLAKLDGILRYGLMLPLTANVGLSFKL